MNISGKAKERFCKDCNVQIRLFQEPYFSDRINLFDKFFGTVNKWNVFVEELNKYNYEQDYFEEYNKIKDAAIHDIKSSEAYIRFNSEDMNNYAIQHNNFPSKDIFKPTNDGKSFIGIDIIKANFSSLHHYDPKMFQVNSGVADTWEEYLSGFTDNRHIINSKYIRQVILGNCNPKRHITYEKYLMDKILTWLIKTYISIDRIVFFSNDEIIIDVSDMDVDQKKSLYTKIEHNSKEIPIPVKTEMFTLYQIKGTGGYYKKIANKNGEEEIEFKCINNYILPFVIRKILKEEYTESDKMFFHEGFLAKFVDVPEIVIPGL